MSNNLTNLSNYDKAKLCYLAYSAYCKVKDKPTVAFDSDEGDNDYLQDYEYYADSADSNLTPEALHLDWYNSMLEDGWVYGDIIDYRAKTHPMLVEYSKLPEHYRVRDSIFYTIAGALK